jgi:hypothetical protein
MRRAGAVHVLGHAVGLGDRRDFRSACLPVAPHAMSPSVLGAVSPCAPGRDGRSAQGSVARFARDSVRQASGRARSRDDLLALKSSAPLRQQSSAPRASAPARVIGAQRRLRTVPAAGPASLTSASSGRGERYPNVSAGAPLMRNTLASAQRGWIVRVSRASRGRPSCWRR